MRPSVLGALVGAAALLTACGGTGPQPAMRTDATPVRTAVVESGTAAGGVRAVGVLAPRNELRLSFKVGGVIERMDVDAGDHVTQGQVLALLKSAEVDAVVAQAAESVDKARRDLERARQLRADEVATEEQVENLTTAFNVARSNLEAARFNARFSRIVAPADGVVQQRLARADELVQGGQPVLVLGATGGGWVVRAALADRDAVRVNIGDDATVRFDAFAGREFAGRIGRVGASADPYTGTFEVEIDLEPHGARFARGLVAKVDLAIAGEAGEVAMGTVVPVAALVEANGPAGVVYVFDAGESIARRRQVRVGPIVGERVIVIAGLTPGEQVVTDGAAWLTDGRAVRIVGDTG